MNNERYSVSRKKIFCLTVPVILLISFTVSGCAPTRLYSVNMNYNAEQAVIPAYLKAADKGRVEKISVAELIDVRQADDQMVIGRVVEKDGTETLVLPKHIRPTQAIAAGIKEYLAKAGYKTSRNAGKWDLKEETIPETDSKIILGGSIEELDISCKKGFPTDSYKAKIKFSLVLAATAKKKILYRSSVEIDTVLEHFSFSEERLEKQINVALAEAIEKIFDDRKTVQKMKEAINE
jgi:hypothetical protein